MSNEFFIIKALLKRANIPTNNLRISYLTSGLTNKNYKVIAGKFTLHVRLGCENAVELGIIRKNEANMLNLLKTYGFVPQVYFMDGQGNMISEFIEGVRPQAKAMTHYENIRSAANILKSVHQSENANLLPKCIFRCVKQDHTALVNKSIKLNPAYSRAITYFCMLNKNNYQIGNCHGDLILNNVIVDATGQIYFLDWEYAGRTQVMYDLAFWTLSCQMQRMQSHFFLQLYFDKVTQQHRQQLKDMRFICLFREVQWSLMQSTMHIENEKYLQRAERYLARIEQECNLSKKVVKQN